jgi:hypothetical protein
MPTNPIAGPVHHGNCYCGAVRFAIGEACSVHASLYCHCESCRRAHSAPVYHVVYIRPEDFSFTHGENLVVHYRKTPATTVSRTFCSHCGSKVANILHNKPWVGFFPATLDEGLQHKLPSKFQPKMHYCGEEAVVDIDRLDPALPVMGADPIKVIQDKSDDASEDGGGDDDDASLSTPRPKKNTTK